MELPGHYQGTDLENAKAFKVNKPTRNILYQLMFPKTLLTVTNGLGELQRQGGASAEHRGGFEEGGQDEQAQVGGGGWRLFS